MGIEIERKFLVVGDGWKALVKATHRLRQGYLSMGGAVTVRVRLIDDARGFLTVKHGGSALARAEFEYEVPVADARQMLSFCRGVPVEKTRYSLNLAGGDWVVDSFEGRHRGLVIAEVELATAADQLQLPDWLGRDVTGEPEYYNSSLALQAGSGNGPERE